MDPPELAAQACDVVEFFAGKGRIARLANSRGWRGLVHDWDFDRARTREHNCMDMCGNAGYV